MTEFEDDAALVGFEDDLRFALAHNRKRFLLDQYLPEQSIELYTDVLPQLDAGGAPWRLIPTAALVKRCRFAPQANNGRSIPSLG
jgi:hypothetical protein